MIDDIEEEGGEFEQVLNRLDALMKRGQAEAPAAVPKPVFVLLDVPAGGSAVEASVYDSTVDDTVDVPVLTAVYRGELPPAAGAAEEAHAPPLLTEVIAIPRIEPGEDAIEVPADEIRAREAPSREQEVEAIVEKLMPELREIIAQAVQKELYNAQQNLSWRIALEAERVLRQALSVKPK